MRTDLPACPIESTMVLIGEKWKALVIRELVQAEGQSRRFSQLKKGIGAISDKMLSQSLKTLEQDGLITRSVVDAAPPRVEYQLTQLGQTLMPVLQAMYQWGETYQQAAGCQQAEESKADP